MKKLPAWLSFVLGVTLFSMLFLADVLIVVGVLLMGGPVLSQLIVVVVGCLMLLVLFDAASAAFNAWSSWYDDEGRPASEPSPEFHLAPPDTELRNRHFRPLKAFLRYPFLKHVNRVKHGR